MQTSVPCRISGIPTVEYSINRWNASLYGLHISHITNTVIQHFPKTREKVLYVSFIPACIGYPENKYQEFFFDGLGTYCFVAALFTTNFPIKGSIYKLIPQRPTIRSVS